MVTKVTGRHTLKLGLNLRLAQGSNKEGSALSGSFSFSGLTTNPQRPAGTGSDLAQFLLGDVTSASCQRITGSTFVGHSLSWFVQDDWKLGRRPTLNLGLGYDFQKKPVERHDGHISFDPQGREPRTGVLGITVYAGRNGQFGSWLFDVTYAGNKGNGFISSGYNLNQVDPKVRAQLGLSSFDQVPNTWAGLIPGGLGGRTVTRERLLMAFPTTTPSAFTTTRG